MFDLATKVGRCPICSLDLNFDHSLRGHQAPTANAVSLQFAADEGAAAEDLDRLAALTGHRLLAMDQPLAALLVVGDHISLRIQPGGCGTSIHRLHFLRGDLVVWRHDFVHGGDAACEKEVTAPRRLASPRGATAPDDRWHLYVDSLAAPRTGNRTDKCSAGDNDGHRGFVAEESVSTREEALASFVLPPRAALRKHGIVVLSGQARLLEVGARALQHAPPTQSWREAIFNGMTEGGRQEDRRRRQWRGRGDDPEAGALSVETAVVQALGQAGLLLHDPDGPWAGIRKTVCDAYALRCLPGCPPQPLHADVSRGILTYPPVPV